MSRQVAKAATRSPATTGGNELADKLLGRVAQRFGVQPATLLSILKEAVFKPPKNDPAPFSDDEMAAALVLVDKYGLDPFTKEVHVTRSRGKLMVVVGVDGWMRVVNSNDSFDGVEFDFERNDRGGIVSCTCRMFDKRRSRPVVVTEYLAECNQGTDPWKQWPARMLRHKAYIQAARIMYGIAGIVDDDEAQRVIDVEAAPSRPIASRPRATIAPPPVSREPEPEAEPVSDDNEAADDGDMGAILREEYWDAWKELRANLTAEQVEECRRAAGVDMLSPSVSVDSLAAAVDQARAFNR